MYSVYVFMYAHHAQHRYNQSQDCIIADIIFVSLLACSFSTQISDLSTLTDPRSRLLIRPAR